MNIIEDKIYKERFTGEEIERKKRIWMVLCNDFFSNYIQYDSTIVDIGCGYGEFINQIKARNKIAIDINPRSKAYLNPEIKFYNSLEDFILENNETIDIIFMSNFLEHIKSKEMIIDILEKLYRTLKKDGRLLILQPNIRYAYREYWDFFDHYTPLSDKSMCEVLKLVNFKIEKVIPQFTIHNKIFYSCSSFTGKDLFKV